jgi:hypothetical protein
MIIISFVAPHLWAWIDAEEVIHSARHGSRCAIVDRTQMTIPETAM